MFKALSISYKQAPVEIREIIALDEYIINEILSEIGDVIALDELLILSTCNRTEVYFSSEEDCTDSLISFIGSKKGISEIATYKQYFEILDSDKAIEHLFRVSLGLEAQVIGDMQISNQIKRAYQLTADANLAGPFLHRLLHSIFYSSKRVAQETSFRDGAASVSYVTSELIQMLATSIVDAKVLIMGLGEIGEDVCRHLSESDLDVTISNRTTEKAIAIGMECGLKTIDFNLSHSAIENADIVICTISNSEPTIKATHLASHKNGIKYLIDLSIPRSIESNVNEILGIELYNIDDIQAKTSTTLDKRLAAIPEVESIISQAIQDFNEWTEEMVVSPTINKLKSALEEIRIQELNRFLKNASKSEKAFAEKLTKSITQKIIKLPVLQLKEACKRGEADALIDVLNDLFDLEKQEQPK